MSRLPAVLQKQAFKVIGSPLFIISNPKLVIAQCKAGIVGSMPALNARPAELLDTWLTDLQRELAKEDPSPRQIARIIANDVGMSGALLKSIVDRAKDYAIKRAIADPKSEQGISLQDLKDAADREFKENEIFPKGDTQEDWLQLLDFAPENVVSVKPIGRHHGEEFSRKSIV